MITLKDTQGKGVPTIVKGFFSILGLKYLIVNNFFFEMVIILNFSWSKTYKTLPKMNNIYLASCLAPKEKDTHKT